MYFLIWEVGGPTDARVYKIEPRAPAEWRAAAPLLSPLPPVSVTVNRIEYVGDLRRADNDYLIGSMHVVTILRGLGDAWFEEHPVKLIDFCSGEQDDRSFRILRLLGDLECLDIDDSAWSVDEIGRATRTRPVLFDSAKIPPERHLFWMRERPAVLVCSDKFKSRWDKLGLRGPVFDPFDGPLKGW